MYFTNNFEPRNNFFSAVSSVFSNISSFLMAFRHEIIVFKGEGGRFRTPLMEEHPSMS